MPTFLPLVHGHRGCRGLRPENTISAFLHAVALGVDALELDVVISADAQVVVSHEPWPSALFCSMADEASIPPATEQQHNFYRLPYATIRTFDCGQRRHPGFPEQALGPAHKPLLSEVIQAADRLAWQLGRPLPAFSVEVKSTPTGDNIFHPEPVEFVRLVLTELAAPQVLERTTLLSFDERILQTARAACPSLRLCLLTEEPRLVPSLFETLGFVPHVWGPKYLLLTQAIIEEVRAAYPLLELVPWTVNAPASMQQLIDWRVTGITTDYPDRLLALLHSKP